MGNELFFGARWFWGVGQNVHPDVPDVPFKIVT